MLSAKDESNAVRATFLFNVAHYALRPWPVPKGILSMLLGCVAVYGFLLGIGQFIYGNFDSGMFIIGLGIVSSLGLFKTWS